MGRLHATIKHWVQGRPDSALWIRIIPFVVFLLITGIQGKLGEDSRFWAYFAKTLAGAGLLWVVWPFIPEMRWRWSWLALGAGMGVFVLWVGLDTLMAATGMPGTYHRLPGPLNPWNPFVQYGESSFWAWILVFTRLAGSTLVVPPLEEVFYRSFVYRYLISSRFETVAMSRFDLRSFVITSTVFALSHGEWLAALLCGFIYQWVVLKKNRLGDAMVAHAITNFLLGLWVIFRPAWHYW
jgi:hypothetical protein